MNDATERALKLGGFVFDSDIERELDKIEEELEQDIEVGVLTLLLLFDINRKVNKLMTDLSGLEAAVQKISEVDSSAAQSLAALRDEVAELKAGEITQEQIDSLAGKLNDASTQLANAVTPAETPPAEPPAEETPPAEEPPAEPTPEGGEEAPPAEG